MNVQTKILLILVILLCGAMPVLAQGDPTATPTQIPLFPSPTPWTRPTPTLISVDDPHIADPLDIDLSSVEHLSDSIIQWYHFINLEGFVDTLIWITLTFALFGMMWRMGKKWRSH